MTLNFPNTPSSGDQFTGSNNYIYEYDGEKWNFVKLVGGEFSSSAIQDGAVTTAKIADDVPLGNRNKIINGDMRLAQRGTAAVTATAAYPVDRFRQLVENTAGAVTFQQETTDVPAGFDYAIKGTVTTADATTDATQRWSIDQKIEGYNVADLRFGTANAKSVTLSFWVKSSVAGVFCVSLLGAGSRGYVNEYTISSANTWEYKTITVPGDTSGTWDITTGTGLQVFFSLTGGSSLQGTAGSWQNVLKECSSNQTPLLQTLNATWLVSGVQLEVGTTATPFEHRTFGDELSRCQRYYQENMVGVQTESGNVLVTHNLVPEMRATPSQALLVAGTVQSGTIANSFGSPTSRSYYYQMSGVTSNGYTVGRIYSYTAEL